MPPHLAPEWYSVSQALMCLGAAWALLSMYARGGPVRQGEPAGEIVRDRGLFWLGMAVLMWAFQGSALLPLGPTSALLVRRLFSSANNACLLIAASHLDYGAELLQRARDWKYWNHAALAGSVTVALLTALLGFWLGPTSRIAQAPDILLSEGTLVLFGFGLFRSFLKRGFLPLAVLAMVALALLCVTQIPKQDLEYVGLTGDRAWVLSQLSKTLTLTVFLSLGMSWVHEVARRPSKASVHLYFTGQVRLGGSRRRFVVRIGDTPIEMRETPHRDLLVLATRRVAEKEREDGGWIALPDLVGRLDDSRIRRMREDLRPAGLDAAIESNFQKAYRLAVEPDRIGFDKKLLAADDELAKIVRPVLGGAVSG